jgi:class 3 adenylate cyclase/tetratricopeptide (TPR) repeat protein
MSGRGDLRGERGATWAPRNFTPPHLAERILNSRSAVEGERKDVTILFADIVGSTQLIENLDAEDALERLQPVLEAMMAAVHRFEGTVTRSMGDGIMALFGAPLAHEDHAVRACLAGLAMQEAVALLGVGAPAIRVGLHSGQVLIRSISNDLSVAYEAVGEAVHLAARMEELCEPGHVRCTEAAQKLVRGFVETDSLGEIMVRGLSRPVRVYEVRLLAAPRTRWQVRAAQGLTPFVGRAEEFAVLGRALDRARAGEGQVVAIVGDAGIGKSRLVHEFVATLGGSDVLVLEAGALPEARTTPYVGAAQLLRSWLGNGAGGDGAAIIDRLRERLGATAPHLLAYLPAYCELLEIRVQDELWLRRDPDDRRNTLQRALRALILALAEHQPLVVLLEDLHWLDEETLSALEGLVATLGRARLVLVVTYRPDHSERWSGMPAFTRHRLEPLGPGEASAFLDLCLGTAPELDGLRQRIAERAAGTPLFIEELVRHLVESDLLSGRHGEYTVTSAVEEIEIPQTIQTVIASRIDRLPPESKDALQVAAVIGSTARAPLLADVVGSDDEALVQVVAPLLENGFLVEVATVPEAEYRFRHALVREVALASISRRRRRNLHRVIVSSMEARHLGRLDPYLDQLAHHARHAEMWEAAVNYADGAARRALDLSAYGLCIRHLDEALQCLENLPDTPARRVRAIDLRLALRAPLGAVGNIVGMHVRLQEASALAGDLASDAQRAAVDVSRTFAFNYTGELADADAAGRSGLDRARATGDDQLVVAGSYHLAQTRLMAGDYDQAIELLGPVLELVRGRFREQRIGTAGTTSVLTLQMLAMAQAYVGRFAEADANAGEAVEIADQLGRPYDQAISRWCKGFVHSQLGVQDRAIAWLEDAYRRCNEADITFLMPIVATSLGFTYASVGRNEEAGAVLERALAQYQKTGLKYGVAYASLNVAYTALQAGDTDRFVARLAEALELARKHGFGGVEVAALRLQAIAGSAKADLVKAARRAAEAALELARRKRMRPDEAHTHLVLARVCGKDGDVDGAKQHAQAALRLYRELGMTSWLERAAKMLGVRLNP